MNIVSNRLPRIVSRDKEGEWIARPASGGLVRALTPILSRTGGRWIGWAGAPEAVPPSVLNAFGREDRCSYASVHLGTEDIRRYYDGFANSTLWPLFHGFANRSEFVAANWRGYLQANQKFDEICAKHFSDGEPVWVHDYHLIPLASMLRRHLPTSRLGFFLHIPFPRVEDLKQLPWKKELLGFLMAYDLVGVQTARDCDRLANCVKYFGGSVRDNQYGDMMTIRLGGHETQVGAFPIGVDFAELCHRAQTRPVEAGVARLRRSLAGRKLILGVDRLDYSKGLLKRLEAFERLLQDQDELHSEVVMLQLVVPSRDTLPEYVKLRGQIEALVGKIIGRNARPLDCPLRYIYGSVSTDELLALYRAADVALVTPLCDGMNLVAKEYCASQIDNEGVLVISEQAGAAEQLAPDALVVGPSDVSGIARTLAKALEQPAVESKRRMQKLRATIRGSDVFSWSRDFMRELQRPSRESSEPVTAAFCAS